MEKVFFTTETAIIVSLVTSLCVGAIRALFYGGALLDPDRITQDGIAGVVIYSLSLFWYGMIFVPEALGIWAAQPLGRLSISGTILVIVIPRINYLFASCRNQR